MIKHKRAFSLLCIEQYITWNFSTTTFWVPIAESNEKDLNWQTSLSSCTSQSNYVLIILQVTFGFDEIQSIEAEN